MNSWKTVLAILVLLAGGLIGLRWLTPRRFDPLMFPQVQIGMDDGGVRKLLGRPSGIVDVADLSAISPNASGPGSEWFFIYTAPKTLVPVTYVVYFQDEKVVATAIEEF